MATNAIVEFDQAAHQRELLLRGRCSACAEKVPLGALVAQEACPHCATSLVWPASDGLDSVVSGLTAKWRGRRLWVYSLLTLSTGLTGFLPIVPTILAVAFLIYMRFAILRSPMQWLSPGRKVTTKLTLKLWIATIGIVTLALSTLSDLIPFANIFIKMGLNLGAGALFIEVALWHIRGRLRLEQNKGAKLEWWEWGLPVFLLAGAMVGGICAFAAFAVAWEIISGLFA